MEAVALFLAIIGAEAGYMGLRALATGGVYLCGGITPKVLKQPPSILLSATSVCTRTMGRTSCARAGGQGTADAARCACTAWTCVQAEPREEQLCCGGNTRVETEWPRVLMLMM